MTRPFSVLEMEQGTPEWFASRCGRVTGSRASAVLAGKDTAARRDYRLQLAEERLTGLPRASQFSTPYTEQGIAKEPLARLAVEQAYGILIRQTGLLIHKKEPIAVSLDGDVNDFECVVELKCPKGTTHIEYMTADKIPAIYRWQITHALYVTGAPYAIFASYDDTQPAGLELYTLAVKAQDLPLAEYDMALPLFLTEVEEMYQRLLHLQQKGLESGSTVRRYK